jgi:hypothetical protein
MVLLVPNVIYTVLHAMHWLDEFMLGPKFGSPEVSFFRSCHGGSVDQHARPISPRMQSIATRTAALS